MSECTKEEWRKKNYFIYQTTILFIFSFFFSELLNHELNSSQATESTSTVKAIDASDILAPSELENSDLLKNDDLNFDLVSKSLQFMTSSVDNDFTTFTSTLPQTNKTTSTINTNPSTTTTTTNVKTSYTLGKFLQNPLVVVFFFCSDVFSHTLF